MEQLLLPAELASRLTDSEKSLKEMLAGLGATVAEQSAAFEPESGAYGGGHANHHDGGNHPLAPIPLRQKIHRPGDSK